MSRIHFLNVLEGDCNIIEHDSKRVTVIDVSNAYNDYDTEEEKAVKNSQRRKDMYERTQVPSDKKDYKQKSTPDNPIHYLKEHGIKDIFRFILTHPDMDHLDGIKDFFEEFNITNFWDTDNKKEISDKAASGGYNMDDWKFYKNIRDGQQSTTNRLTYFSGNENSYYKDDYIEILSPTSAILNTCNQSGNWNDSSYVLLYTPPKANGKRWKILFAGDSEGCTWEHILKEHHDKIQNIDVLFAPHHGRDSGRNYDFLKVLNPKVTLFGNASSKHLAYKCYNSEVKITNNQAGYVILDISENALEIYVKNLEFARDFHAQRGWGEPRYNKDIHAYFLGKYKA
ncbi:ComEC/Rec2 family competence protein [Sphingobacterium luzhongxinii]|uniref:ComEC/Rec2 family competence protein n=1 Tax=Sphingobacterium luzhongxinii TaxID=2654181 RepID=UPI0013DCF5EA|nr:MBL fold metallo-hydrolase [Sphingobacterium sp. xlx-73]